MDAETLQRLDRLLGDPNVPQEDKRRAVAMARVQDSQTTTTPTTEDSALERGAGYLATRGKDWWEATNRMFQPESLAHPLQELGDVATATAPVVAPYLTAAGVLGGTVARTAGLSPEDAGLVETGLNVLGGAGSTVLGAGRRAAGLRGEINAAFGGVRDRMAQAGTLLPADSPAGQQLFWNLARATRRFTGTGRAAARDLMRTLARGTGVTYGDIDDALTAVQGARNPSAIAGILREARNAMTTGTAEAQPLQAANRAARLSRRTIPGVNIARTVLGAGGAGAAGYEAMQGHYGRAAGALALGALGATGAGTSVGHLLAAGRGAAGPAARAGVSLAQTPGVQSLGRAAPPSAPSDLEDTPDEPTIQRTTPAPAGPTRDRRAAAPSTAGPYGREVDAVSRLAGVPAPLLRSFQRQENARADPNAVSHPEAGQAQTPAVGLMQITPGTFNIYREDAEKLLGRKAEIRNPFDNLLMSGLLIKNYLDKTGGDIEAAARLYFGGENTRAHGARTYKYGQDIVDKYRQASR